MVGVAALRGRGRRRVDGRLGSRLDRLSDRLERRVGAAGVVVLGAGGVARGRHCERLVVHRDAEMDQQTVGTRGGHCRRSAVRCGVGTNGIRVVERIAGCHATTNDIGSSTEHRVRAGIPVRSAREGDRVARRCRAFPENRGPARVLERTVCCPALRGRLIPSRGNGDLNSVSGGIRPPKGNADDQDIAVQVRRDRDRRHTGRNTGGGRALRK